HPLPLILLFSDGKHNVGPSPLTVAEQIKALTLDGEGPLIATAGIRYGDEEPDEQTLRKIASSPECYVRADNLETLRVFLAKGGSSGASRPEDFRGHLGTGS